LWYIGVRLRLLGKS